MASKPDIISFNDFEDAILSDIVKLFKNEVEPINVEEITISETGIGGIEQIIKKASFVFNREFVTQNERSISNGMINDSVDLFRKLLPYSSYLESKTKSGEIVGSLFTTIKAGGVFFKIGSDSEDYLLKNHRHFYDKNIFYGSMTFVDKEFIEKSGFNKNLAIKLWEQMLRIACRKIINVGDGIYFSYTEKSAYSVIKRVLGMEWEQMGKEIEWLNSTVVPSVITTDAIKKWLSKK